MLCHMQMARVSFHVKKNIYDSFMFTFQPLSVRCALCLQQHMIQIAASVSLSQVLPASCDLLPSSVLMFRLLSMPSKQCAVSAVVAWGVFPVCDCSLTLIQGRFRTPLLRGCPNSAIDQFSKIERLLSADLDYWLCNLYFQVLILNCTEPLGPGQHI